MNEGPVQTFTHFLTKWWPNGKSGLSQTPNPEAHAGYQFVPTFRDNQLGPRAGEREREWDVQETRRMRASQSYWSSSENFIQEWQYKHKQEEAPREGGRAQGLSEGQVAIFSSWNQWSQCPLYPQTFLLLWPRMFSQDCLCKLENIHKAMAEAMAPGISSLLIIFNKAPWNWGDQYSSLPWMSGR